MTNARDTPARLKVRALGIVIDLTATAVVLGWLFMAATGHSDGDIRILTVTLLMLLALTVVAWVRWRAAKRRALDLHGVAL
ncbi:hypothetical protein ACWIGW_45950 [Nocardia brasiliensis]